jgi:hypothetical protein
MNLAPQADAYKRDDVLEEEAIACIEALARVPQQVNKYGHGFTKACMHELYHLYYDEVIPACYQAYGHYTGKEFSCDMTPIAMPLSVKLKRLYRYLRGKTEQMPKL